MPGLEVTVAHWSWVQGLSIVTVSHVQFWNLSPVYWRDSKMYQKGKTASLSASVWSRAAPMHVLSMLQTPMWARRSLSVTQHRRASKGLSYSGRCKCQRFSRPATQIVTHWKISQHREHTRNVNCWHHNGRSGKVGHFFHQCWSVQPHVADLLAQGTVCVQWVGNSGLQWRQIDTHCGLRSPPFNRKETKYLSTQHECTEENTTHQECIVSNDRNMFSSLRE